MTRKKTNIELMVESGRAPGAIIRGRGDFKHEAPIPVDRRFERGGRSSRELERDHEKVHAIKRKAAKQAQEARRLRKPRSGEIRHIGSMPFEEMIAARKTMGEEAFQGENTRKTLKRLDRSFED